MPFTIFPVADVSPGDFPADHDASPLWCTGGAPEGEVPLRQRRALLMDGLAGSLRLGAPLPPGAAPRENGGAGKNTGETGAVAAGKGRKRRAGKQDDGVLCRLLTLRKGRDLLARALALMVPPQVRA